MTQPQPIAALAPMDGVTDRAYRQIVRRLNPKVWLYSEFTSVNGIEHSSKVKDRVRFQEQEKPLIVQLFGREPKLFAKIAQEIALLNPSGIDINFGCPAKRIVRAGNGAALLQEAELAFRIVEATVQATSIPVSVKTRLGWFNSENLVSFAQGLESAGAGRLTLHGRTAKQGYRGVADWEPIYALKERVRLPIFGNGDLASYDQGLKKLKNLDGFMIGRAAIGDPWVFWPEAEREKVTLKEKIEVMIQHFQLLRQDLSEARALIEFRKHLGGYIKGFQDAKSMRQQLMQAQTEQEFTEQATLLA